MEALKGMDPELVAKMQQQMQGHQAEADQMNQQMDAMTGSKEFRDKLDTLKDHPELKHVFDEMKKLIADGGGSLKGDALRKFINDAELLKKLGQHMHDLPPEVKAAAGMHHVEKDSEATTVPPEGSLHTAVREGDLSKIEKFIAEGKHPNEIDTQGRTAFHYAAGAGHEAVVQKLIAARADTEALDPEKNTPLLFSAGYGHAKVTKMLLDGGAKPLANADGKSPFDVADMNPNNPIKKDTELMDQLKVKMEL